MIKMIRALKFCRFGGKDYYAKDVVPDSAVDKKMIGSLVKMKVIEVTPDEPPQPKPKPKSAKKK